MEYCSTPVSFYSLVCCLVPHRINTRMEMLLLIFLRNKVRGHFFPRVTNIYLRSFTALSLDFALLITLLLSGNCLKPKELQVIPKVFVEVFSSMLLPNLCDFTVLATKTYVLGKQLNS